VRGKEEQKRNLKQHLMRLLRCQSAGQPLIPVTFIVLV
jgi:hypothetical protein